MEYSFSRHEHRIEAPDFDPSWYQLDYAGATTMPLFRHFNFIIKTVRSIPENIVQHLGPALRALATLRIGMVKQIEATRNGRDDLHTSSSHSTIFHDILSSKLPEDEKSTDRLADEAFLLVAAATETTSWTLTVATFHLLANPQILRRLKEELKGVYPDGKGHVSLAALQNLPYLTTILSEALRLTYGVAHRLQRIFHEPLTYTPSSLVPSASKAPKEYVIPPGTPISMCIVDLTSTPPASQTHTLSIPHAGSPTHHSQSTKWRSQEARDAVLA
jgi:cytochrome P450